MGKIGTAGNGFRDLMSFYDDLGVRQGATSEEVREQYRLLVRLFHPDQFADPALKAAAEGQMRRFNEIAAILTDPEQRHAYEAEAARLPIVIQAPQAAIPARRIPWNSLAWGTAALACAAAIVWVSGHEQIPAPPVVEVRTILAQPPSLPSTNEWQVRAKVAWAERDQALRELARLRGESIPPRASVRVETPQAVAFSSEPFIPVTSAAPTPITEANSSSSSFAGLWFYARRPGVSGKRYAPEFIETQITERDGQVRGRYRSRYRVTDQAISPSVNFEFVGQAAGTSAQMPLTRDDGARGEVRLRLISEHEMELDWTATGSTSPSLTSGTAILVKGR